MSAKINRKNAGCFFLISIPATLLILLTIVFLTLLFIFANEYGTWRDRFENSHLNSEFTVIAEAKDISASLQNKIDVFAKSSEEIEVLELTPQETLYIVSLQLEETLPKGTKIYRGYVDSDFGSWNIYLQPIYKDNLLPWMILSLNKDEGVGVQLYISTISIGGYDLTEYGMGASIDEINRGLNDALLLVNQSDFTGRTFENIELEPNVLTIRGRR